jgi:hypothetical protein
MGYQIGRLINVGFTKESVRGTAEATGSFWMPKIDFDFVPKAEYAVNESGLGVIDGRSDAKVVEKLGEGSFGGLVRDKDFGLLLAACLGTWSTTGPTDSAYTHAFTRLNTNQHPSLSLFANDETSDEVYALAMLNQLTINCVLKDYVKFNAGFISKVGEDTTQTPSYTAQNDFLATHVSVKFASTIAALGTASATPVRAFNLTFNKNVIDWQNLGSVDPTEILNRAFLVSGDMELVFDSETVRDYAVDGSKKACLLKIENTDVLLGTASTPKLEITLSPMSFRDWGKGTDQNEITTQTVAFDGNFGISDSKTVSASLVNAQVSY